MQMLASQFTHEMLALGADNLSSGHLFRYWRAAPPPALAGGGAAKWISPRAPDGCGESAVRGS